MTEIYYVNALWNLSLLVYVLEGAFFIYLKLPMQLKSAMQSLFYDSFLDLSMLSPGVPDCRGTDLSNFSQHATFKVPEGFPCNYCLLQLLKATSDY